MATIFPLRPHGHGGKNCLAESRSSNASLKSELQIKSLSLIQVSRKRKVKNCANPETVTGKRGGPTK